jgi:hypothetical protein
MFVKKEMLYLYCFWIVFSNTLLRGSKFNRMIEIKLYLSVLVYVDDDNILDRNLRALNKDTEP